MCAKLKADEGWKSSVKGSRPPSIVSEPEKRWIDIVTGKKYNLIYEFVVECFIFLYVRAMVSTSSVFQAYKRL